MSKNVLIRYMLSEPIMLKFKTTPSDGFGTWAGIGGWLGERAVCSVWADLPVPGFVGAALRQVFFCSGRIPVGGTRAWWR